MNNQSQGVSLVKDVEPAKYFMIMDRGLFVQNIHVQIKVNNNIPSKEQRRLQYSGFHIQVRLLH